MLPAVLLLLAAAPTPRFPQGTAPMRFLEKPEGLVDWSSEGCERCHAAEAEAHGRSGHGQARSDLVLQVAVEEGRAEWCTTCHAPLAKLPPHARPPSSAPLDSQGIPCAACHAEGTKVAVSKPAPFAPHGTVVSESLRTGAVCEGCHQFGFPVLGEDGAVKTLCQEHPQQDTFAEWKRSPAFAEGKTCVGCHFEDHSAGGVRRVEALRDALVISLGAHGRMLTLRTEGVGHRFPTGDVMRWISVETSEDPLFERFTTAATFEKKLGRIRHEGDGVAHQGVLADTTLLPGVAYRVPLPHPARYVRVVYHLVSREQERDGRYPEGLSRLTLFVTKL